MVGDLVGAVVGDFVGIGVGFRVGRFVGGAVGLFVGDIDGAAEGVWVGFSVGGLVGVEVGIGAVAVHESGYALDLQYSPSSQISPAAPQEQSTAVGVAPVRSSQVGYQEHQPCIASQY